MSEDARRMMMFESRKKSTGVAYLLWFFFGIFGVHRFYLKRDGSGAAILLLTLTSIVTSIIGIGLILLLIPAFWVLIDIFLIPGMTRDYNVNLAQSLL